MKTSIKSFVSLCAIYFLASGLALAEPAVVFVDEDGCGLLKEDWTWPVDSDDVIIGDLHQVNVNNDNGNVHVTCSQDIEPTSTGRSVIFNFDNTDGLKCRISRIPDVTTEDWHQVISRNGKAKLVCHYKLP